jgi:mannose-6-phosphate isomerase-like protein (cupin superfamily)
LKPAHGKNPEQAPAKETFMLGKLKRVVTMTDVPAEDIAGFPGFKLRRVSEPTVEGASQLFRVNHDTIAPGGGCDRHFHRHSEEAWFILSGSGHFYCDGKLTAVKAGDCSFAEMSAVHQIINSGTEPLVFMTVTVPPCDMENDLTIVEHLDYEKHLAAAKATA